VAAQALVVIKAAALRAGMTVLEPSAGTGNIATGTTNNSWYSTGTTASWTTQMQAGVWYHVVATYNGSYVKIYINGVLEGTGVQAISGNIIRYALPVRFGYPSSATINYFNGKIDEVRIYNSALGAAGVQRLYDSYPAFVSEWKLNSDTNDTAGNNNATANGGTSWTTGRKGSAINLNGSTG